MSVTIRSSFSPQLRVPLENTEPSLTKQSFRDECDINNILRRYKKQVSVDFFQANAGYFQGRFEDVSDVPDYQAALHQIDEAKAVFGAMPAILRRRFGNDPAELLDFVTNSANREEAISLGFILPSSSLPPVEATPVKG